MSTQIIPRDPAALLRLAVRGPEAEQVPGLVTVIYRFWLVAFTLKMLGSTWDMSWHFKWLRDTAAPPHILNTIGTVMVVVLVIYQARFNVGVDAMAKRLMVFGTAIFLIAIPIDIINHAINGLDITAWSASHALLYVGTAFMLLGSARGYWISTPPSRIRTVVSAVLWGFFLENVLFPSQHQEYGVLALKAWLAGTPTAEPMLLDFAAKHLDRPVDIIAVTGFALPVDSWVYPAWMAGAALVTLVAARHFVGARWAATAIAGGYLAYRCIAWILLSGTGFPPSIPPFFLLAGGIAIDLVFLAFARPRPSSVVPPSGSGWRPPASGQSASSRSPALNALADFARRQVRTPGWPNQIGFALCGAAVATGAIAAAAWIQKVTIGTPPIDWIAFAYGAIALAIAWAAITLTDRSTT